MALQLRGIETEGNPFIDEGPQALVVGQLLADGGEVFQAHPLAQPRSRALPPPVPRCTPR